MLLATSSATANSSAVGSAVVNEVKWTMLCRSTPALTTSVIGDAKICRAAAVRSVAVVSPSTSWRSGDAFTGTPFSPTRETIRAFCEASLDFNPLHLDDDYMKGNFGKTNFGGIIMHGMNNFGLISRMITDWAYPRGAVHRRLETRWVKPVRPGDTIQPIGIVKSKQVTKS